MEEVILKFTRNCKGPQTAETVMKKKNKVARFTYFDVRTHYKATVIKTVWYWDFPGGPVDKPCASNSWGVGSIPGWGTKIPHAM